MYTVEVYYDSQWFVWTQTTYNRAAEIYEKILDYWQNCRVVGRDGFLYMAATREGL